MNFDHAGLPSKWNREIFTFEDFEQYCLDDGVIVATGAIALPGCYMSVGDFQVIVLRNNLRGINKLRVALHELGHHWLHTPGRHNYCGNDSKAETEARIVEACALIPAPVLLESPLWEIGDMYGYPKDLLKFRQRILQYYGF